MFGWLGRKFVLYVMLVLAILIAAFVVPWVKAEWTGPDNHIRRAEQLEDINAALKQRQSAIERQLDDAAQSAKEKSLAEVDAMLGEAHEAREAAISRRRSEMERTRSFVRLDGAALLSDRMLELEIQYYDRQIIGLRAARERLVRQNALESLVQEVQQQAGQLKISQDRANAAQKSCDRAQAQLTEFEARWSVRLTLGLYQTRERQALQRARDTQCRHAKGVASSLETAVAASRLAEQKRASAQAAYQQASGWAGRAATSVTDDIERRIEAERASAAGSIRARVTLWADKLNLISVMKQAALLLALVIAMPYLIRLFCYYILAPAAMRRPAIRLQVPGGGGHDVPMAERSSTSVAITLLEKEELLIRQDYLQSSSRIGDKRTQWFMDWRHPLTSMVAGLTFLTRISGEGQMTSVSAVNDPFAEVTILTLPEGASCVLQPRALAAYIQQKHHPLRITSHWRIFSLNAWLTMQLRYLVFHGPARLVIKGGRGVRVERAQTGRIFGQDQLVGFSADLSYSVTRAETFWPYFLGRESLLKDKVEEGEGVLIVEEAPLAGRKSGEVKHGIEGMIDAAMKALGM